MVYRRTTNVARKLAARQSAIVSAAHALAAEGGMSAVQIVPVARHAGIAAGTVYRYFPAKTDLVAALVAVHSEREIGAMAAAADAAPGPLSALAAAIAIFATRALRSRRLSFAVLTEPVEPEIDAARQPFRQALSAELARRIGAVIAAGMLADIPRDLAVAAVMGAMIEGLIGPSAPDEAADEAHVRDTVQTITLFALRALGVVDARARGLVVQIVLPSAGEGA